MSRRYVAKNLYDGVDPVYQSVLIHMVVNRLIRQGNKNLSYRILYTALDRIREKTKRNPMIVLEHAIRMVTPNVQLKVRRVGGTNYQVPIEVRPRRGTTVAIQWILKAARSRPGRDIATRLSEEIMDSVRGSGGAVRKREEVHRIADANKAFARYRFSLKSANIRYSLGIPV